MKRFIQILWGLVIALAIANGFLVNIAYIWMDKITIIVAGIMIIILLEEHKNGFHLTLTDVVCDPLKNVTSIEIRSIATETFFGLAGVTLMETRE